MLANSTDQSDGETASDITRWNVFAIASFVFGAVPVVPVIASIAAIGLGIMARNRIALADERGGLAKWGIALGIVWLLAGAAYAAVVAYLLIGLHRID